MTEVQDPVIHIFIHSTCIYMYLCIIHSVIITELTITKRGCHTKTTHSIFTCGKGIPFVGEVIVVAVVAVNVT